MRDCFNFEVERVFKTTTLLQQKINDYEDKICELTNLVQDINKSDSWIDNRARDVFINSCNSYIKKYNDLSVSMKKQVDYLLKKSNIAKTIEEIYSGR